MSNGFSGSIPFENPQLWHNRGYLQHYEGAGVYQLITYRLGDSLPRKILDEIQCELKSFENDEKETKKRKITERYLDSGYGSCVLKYPEVARAVIENWKYFDGLRYNLVAGVVMPNHVHVLIKTKVEWPIGKVVWTWKKYISKIIYEGGYFAASACGARAPSSVRYQRGESPLQTNLLSL